MAKPQRKKKKPVAATMTKSVFLHGKPNMEKLHLLTKLQTMYTDGLNTHIQLLHNNPECLLPLLRNDERNPIMRNLEKEHRIHDLGATYSQVAFDAAAVLLHNRLICIKNDVYHATKSILAKITVLYYCVLTGKSKSDMTSMLEEIKANYKRQDKIDEYQKIIDTLKNMSDDDFNFQYNEVFVYEQLISQEYKVPYVKKAEVSIDKRTARLEKPRDTKCSRVLCISIPKALKPEGASKEWIEIPLLTSSNSERRLDQYDVSKGMRFTIKSGYKLKVSVSFEKKTLMPNEAGITKTVGVDVGITDALHTSDNEVFGSMSPVIQFYKEKVEKLLGQISSMRNKKKRLLHYLHSHKKTLPAKVVKQLRDRIDRIESNIRHTQAAYYACNKYHNMVAHECRKAVDEYVASLHGDKSVLTVIELLDIKEFDKSRRQNGKYSMFARGQLSSKLMSTLNWHGYRFVQVDPAYTSQTCPKCSNQDEDNRHGKKFHCTCCGFEADADHVGSINIRNRASDVEIQTLCNKLQYNQSARHIGLRELFKARNLAWKEAHPDNSRKAETAVAA